MMSTSGEFAAILMWLLYLLTIKKVSPSISAFKGRATSLHYTDHQWTPRVTFRVGVDSIDHMSLVLASEVILPPLHIKLHLVRNFTRALDHSGAALTFLKTVFPKLRAAKIDAGKFTLHPIFFAIFVSYFFHIDKKCFLTFVCTLKKVP